MGRVLPVLGLLCLTGRFIMAAPRLEHVQYLAAHARVYRSRGKASEYICQCGNTAQHWAFMWRTTPQERWVLGKEREHRVGGISIYSLDENDYEAMCARCASWYDRDDRLRDFVFSGSDR